ncbi:MAG TPA: GNAT family N-acetyltransferase [Candidatus Kapabacteria bacterium]|nr:GNAT family N-acetyltransferase [Candidatus Kapabacteria bacterium]
MSTHTFQIVRHGSQEYRETVALRDSVLRRPLGLHFTPEQLAAETGDIHLACYDGNALVACLILTPVDARTVKMRQVAVAQERQAQGVGRALVERSEHVARERGFAEVVLNARLNVVPFYERLGYECVGGVFEEVTIPHRAMRKTLA